jgi:hypothetical protein
VIRKNNFIGAEETARLKPSLNAKSSEKSLTLQSSKERLLSRTSKVQNLLGAPQAAPSHREQPIVATSLNSTLRSKIIEDHPDNTKFKPTGRTMKRLESARRNRIQQLKESVVNTNSS